MQRPTKIFLISIIVLAIAGVILSAYSLYHFVAVNADLQSGQSLCNLGERFNCDAIARSRYSVLFGLPLSSYGLWFYFSLLIFFALSLTSLVSPQVFYGVLSFTGLLSSFYSVYLFYVARALIGTVCIVCFLMYVVNFGFLTFAFIAAHRQKQGLFKLAACGASAIFRWPFVSLWILRPERLSSAQGWLSRGGLLLCIVWFFSIFFLSVPLTYEALLALGRGDVKLEQAFHDWQSQKPQEIPLTNEEGSLTDYRLGEPTAPVQIVEFLDYECPACRSLYVYMHKLIEENANRVQFTLKNYPLDHRCNPGIQGEFHLYSCLAVRIARCAGEQGQFWLASDHLMQSPHLEEEADLTQVRRMLVSELESLGLDAQAIEQCLESGRSDEKIRQDIELAERLDIAGTPSVFVNGKKLERVSPDLFQKIIDVLSKS